MSKVKVNITPPVEAVLRSVEVTLTPTEAVIITALLGRCSGSLSLRTQDLYRALKDALPEKQEEYADHLYAAIGGSLKEAKSIYVQPGDIPA